MRYKSLLLSLLLLASCTIESDFTRGTRKLQTLGYTEVNYMGQSWIPNGITEVYATHFVAADTAGFVHEGWFYSLDGKTILIRFK